MMSHFVSIGSLNQSGGKKTKNKYFDLNKETEEMRSSRECPWLGLGNKGLDRKWRNLPGVFLERILEIVLRQDILASVYLYFIIFFFVIDSKIILLVK